MIRLEIKLDLKYSEKEIKEAVCARLPLGREEITELRILKRSLVLRDGERPYYKCSVAVGCSEERERGLLKIKSRVKEWVTEHLEPLTYGGTARPVVVGAGPAGLFCALYLAQCGARPLLIERGECVEERQRRVELFNTLGILDPECNVQFGEGGAGTFSDGKLKVGAHDKYKDRVLEELIAAGADPSVYFSDTAHLGTDRLPGIMRHLRERITELGGEIEFGARLTDIITEDGEISGIRYTVRGEERELSVKDLVLAIGHSASDTISTLWERGVKMEPRGFGIGMRVEHPREYIDRLVYGVYAAEIGETASYHLVTHLENGRSVYSFCMCPGGTVVGATGQEGSVVTNGMSEHARMGDNSNAAILVSVTPADFGSDSPLAGIALQRRIERRAFSLTDSYRAPVCALSDVMGGGGTASMPAVRPSYLRGTEPVSPRAYLPDYATDSLKAGFLDFDRWMPGYMLEGAALTGPETRTTSPIRMTRGESREAIGIAGLYPAGEGAGYAGGIVSSAQDGLRTAEAIIMKYNTKGQ